MYHEHKQYRQRFSKEEDERLEHLTNAYSNNDNINWKAIASQMKDRTSRQCRERFYNYLLQKTRKGNWTKEEDELILNLYNKLGPKWVDMTSYFVDRSNIDIKNRYSSLTRSKNANFHQEYNRDHMIHQNNNTFNYTVFDQSTILLHNERPFFVTNFQYSFQPILLKPIVYIQ